MLFTPGRKFVDVYVVRDADEEVFGAGNTGLGFGDFRGGLVRVRRGGPIINVVVAAMMGGWGSGRICLI